MGVACVGVAHVEVVHMGVPYKGVAHMGMVHTGVVHMGKVHNGIVHLVVTRTYTLWSGTYRSSPLVQLRREHIPTCTLDPPTAGRRPL